MIGKKIIVHLYINKPNWKAVMSFKGEWKSDIIVLLVNEGEQERLNSENLSKIRLSVQELWIFEVSVNH